MPQTGRSIKLHKITVVWCIPVGNTEKTSSGLAGPASLETQSGHGLANRSTTTIPPTLAKRAISVVTTLRWCGGILSVWVADRPIALRVAPSWSAATILPETTLDRSLLMTKQGKITSTEENIPG
ncbi:unnamed protein product [Calypogeia fissa]